MQHQDNFKLDVYYSFNAIWIFSRRKNRREVASADYYIENAIKDHLHIDLSALGILKFYFSYERKFKLH